MVWGSVAKREAAFSAGYRSLQLADENPLGGIGEKTIEAQERFSSLADF